MTNTSQPQSEGSEGSAGIAFLDRNHRDHKELSTENLVKPVQRNPEHYALRFASGFAGHYLRFSPDREEFVVVHAGPHGPEHRPACIDMRNIESLHQQCEKIESVLIADTPYITPEIRGI